MNESPPTSLPTRKSLRSRVTLEPSSTYTINCSSPQLSVSPTAAQSSQNDTLASRTRRKSSRVPLSTTTQSLKVLTPTSSQTYGRSKRKTTASNDSGFNLIQQPSSEFSLNVSSEQAVHMKRGPGRPRKHPLLTGVSFSDKPTLETKDVLVDRSHSLRANISVSSLAPLPKVKKRVTITNGVSEKVAHRRKRPRLDTDFTTEAPRTSLDELRQQWISEREVQLQAVIASHEAILRELYYMEVFQDMTTFDLLKIKDDKSERIAKFMQGHDLWLTVTDQVIQKSQSHANKISTRHSLNQRRESLVNMLQKSVASSSVGPDPSVMTSSSLNLYRRPSNVKQFSSLEDYLASFVTLSDNEDLTPEQADRRVEQEAEILHRIQHYKSQGLLQPKHTIKPQPEPIPSKTIYDDIIEHLPATAKYVRESGKFRRAGAKKVAFLVRTYWERLKTKDQREQKEEDRRIRKLAKSTATEIKKKWRLVERVVEARYKEVLQQEQAQKGKRHLNLILEHSTQVLGHQKEFLGESGPGRGEEVERGKGSSEVITREQEANDIEYEEGVEEENENEELVEYEESSDDDEELKGLEAERDMPIEELMKRYSIRTNGVIHKHGGVEENESDTKTDPDMSAGGEEGDESDIEEENEANENEDQTISSITFDSKQILGSTRVISKPAKIPTKSVVLREILKRADADENDAEFKETESAYESPDDETTLDTEENTERSEDEEEEIAGLADDVNVPIEVLLQRYGVSALTTNGHAEGSSKNGSQTDVSATKVATTTASKLHGYEDETEDEILDEDKSDGSPSFDVEEDEIDIIGVSDEDRNEPLLAPIILDPEDGSDLSMDEGGKVGEDAEPDPDPEATETEFEDEVSEDEEMIARKQEKSSLRNKATNLSNNIVETNDTMTSMVAEPPSGTTLATTNVKTKFPFLLRGVLREYQRVGLDWLASLYNNGLNGILADEMGLGKTIQTIALLAYLACEKEVWGPHLIVVPTSVMLNWEMEFKKWLPGFKILTYYGNPKERKEKRVGWSKDNSFHVCVTSYQLVVQDQNVFRRKAWRYLILDEAHNIKNFRSQRWQVLLNFNSHRRLLLTGTPLQNNLMELWSLLYFLMPNGVSQNMPIGFANQKEFQEWFSHPLDRMVENNTIADDETRATIQKLHTVLRPYLLRRLKADVEKQMPAKYEHIVYCRLSKRQRFLYDDFMSRAKTRETLASGNFLSIINCLMQLRKVCNHPDLFEVRPIVTSFAMSKIVQTELEIKELLVRKRLLRQADELREKFNLQSLNLLLLETEGISRIIADLVDEIDATELFNLQIKNYDNGDFGTLSLGSNTFYDLRLFTQASQQRSRTAMKSRWEYMRRINHWRYQKRPLYGIGLIDLCRKIGAGMIINIPLMSSDPRRYLDYPNAIAEAIIPSAVRVKQGEDVIKRFAFITPKVIIKSDPVPVVSDLTLEAQLLLRQELSQIEDVFHPIQIRLQIAFPDKRLLQYDCGKLQKLDELLRDLKAGGHRALIFTQMTRVLDVLEIFLNIHGHRYLRLDGATKVDQRQALTERFNNDTKILVFILSTRSGGLGINLTGADTVVFYDSDWNPCMDRQCQDRAHRIGQTRDVNIFRFVSEFTIEENMLRKANQKRMLDNVVITEGEFTTDYFQKMDWRDLLNPEDLPEEVRHHAENTEASGRDLEQALLAAEDENDAIAARVAQQEMDMDITEFSEMPSATATEKTASAIEVELNHGEPPPIQEQTIGHIDDYMLKFVERELGVYLGFGGVANPDGCKSASPTKFMHFTSSGSRPSAAPSSISEEDQREREPDEGSQIDTSDYEDPSQNSLTKNQDELNGEHEDSNDAMEIYDDQIEHGYNGDIGRDDEEDRYDVFSGEDEVVSGEDE